MKNLLMKLWIKQNSFKSTVKEALDNERGQGMVEYGLILSLIAIVVIGMLTGIGQSLLAKFTDINNSLSGTTTTT